VPVVLFDLPAKEGPEERHRHQGHRQPEEAQARAAGRARRRGADPAANYEEHLDLLAGCDLVIEAIAERMDWKLDLYTRHRAGGGAACHRGQQHLGPVDHQAERGAARGDQAALLRHPLLQPAALHGAGGADQHPGHAAEVLDQLEAFVTSALGKGVVRAKDTPNFIANRVGIAGMLATMKEAEKFGLSYDVVDDLTGKKLGRASSGTFRTADVVGLDTMAHVIKTLQDNLADDPFFPSYATPPVLAALIEQGRAGPEDRRRLLQEGGQGHPALDPPRATTCRRRQGRRHRRAHAEEARGRAAEAAARVDQPAGAVPVGHPARRLPLRRGAPGRHRRQRTRVDFAMRWGFGMKQGPFELWQEAGWQQVAEWVKEDIDAGKALSSAPLPAWVFDGRTGVHTPEGSWSPSRKAYVPRSSLPVYDRQYFPETCWAAARHARAEGRHRGLQERRGARLDAGRRGADRQHHQPSCT
jgi:3-hydroxyacyl-CoA dehydrogenase